MHQEQKAVSQLIL